MSVDTVIIVPARRGSNRIVDKPLLNDSGMPLAIESMHLGMRTDIGQVLLATDCDDLLWTDRKSWKKSGTVRIGRHPSALACLAAVIESERIDVHTVIMLSCDQPRVPVADIQRALTEHLIGGADVTSVLMPTDQWAAIRDQHNLKAIVTDNRVRWFSRAPVPLPVALDRDVAGFVHCGIDIFTINALANAAVAEPSSIELQEDAEPIRYLTAGLDVRAYFAPRAKPPLCTLPRYLKAVRWLKSQPTNHTCGSQTLFYRRKRPLPKNPLPE